METVIALPLLLLLIGGIMWFGQLIYDKQTLVIADRYVAWNCGNWHDIPVTHDLTAFKTDVQNHFFTNTSDTVTSLAPVQKGPPNTWWYAVQGAVNLGVNMPSWTYGFLSTDAIMKGRLPADVDAISNVPSFHGRDVADDSPTGGGHWVVMRSGFDDHRLDGIDPGPPLGPLVPLPVDLAAITNEVWAPTGHP